MRPNRVPQKKRKPAISRPLEQRVSMHVLVRVGEWALAAILIGMIGVLGFFAYKRITQHAFFPLKKIHVEQSVIYADPNTIVDVVKNYGSADMLHVNVNVLASEIKKLDWVKEAKVQKAWPDTINVSVVERIPILRWGDNRFLDSDGVVFHDPPAPGLESLFEINGPEGYETEVLKMYHILIPWLRQEGISSQALQLDSRLVWHLKMAPDIDVIIGRDNLEQRLRKLVVVNERIVKDKAAYISAIDLRYQEGFSIRWKDGVTPQDNSSDKNLKQDKG